MAKAYYSTVFETPAPDIWKIVRDFNNYPVWVAGAGESRIEDGKTGDTVGAVRSVLYQERRIRQRSLALSDLEQSCTYCLLDTPIPLFNYVAHVRLLPVTDGDRTFWHWECRFTTRVGDEQRLTEMVGEQIYQAGFDAVRKHLQEAE